MSYSIVFNVHSIIIDITVINVRILHRRRHLPLILIVLHHRRPILGIVLAAATETAARSVADEGIDVDDLTAAAISDDAASMLEKGITIKIEPRILVFRCSTRYYNLVWAVD